MPRKHLPWIKLWFEMLGDPKMTRLTLAERGCWHEILLLAGQSPSRGKLMLTETEPMTLEDIARALSLTPDEFPVMESCIAKLTRLNSLTWNEHKCLEVVHFEERQGVPQYIDESKAKIVQREKEIKQMLVQRLWNNDWQPTGEQILLVEEEKRIGNLYIDILAKTMSNSLILIEVKPFSLQPSHLGQVKRYLAALREQINNPVTAFLIGRDHKNISIEEAKALEIHVLTFKDIGVIPTVIPTVAPTSNQLYIEEEGRGEGQKKESSPNGEDLPAQKTSHEGKMERFNLFWKHYPKKKSKGQAEKAFYKINPDEQLLATMLATIERAKKSADWLKENGRYIPHPATWLNAKGWEDEHITPQGGTGGDSKKHTKANEPLSRKPVHFDPSRRLR